MNFKEEIKKYIESHPALAFVKIFLHDHPRAELYLVGGALRDLLLHRLPPPSYSPLGQGGECEVNFDFVIRNLSAPKIESWFSHYGTFDLVEKKFGVFKFIPSPYQGEGKGGVCCIDIALPRVESAQTNSLGGTTEFDVESDPELSIEVDLARRDFTVNALAFDVRSKTVLDPFHGKKDLAKKILRAVGNPKDRFAEDLTRILRAIRFAAELNFTIEPKTWRALKTHVPDLNRLRRVNGKQEYVVAREIIGEELSKAFLANPATTTYLLRESGVLEELFPGVWRCLHLHPHYLDPLLSQSKKQKGIEHMIVLLLRGLTEEEVKAALEFTGLITIEKHSKRRVEMELVLWFVHKLAQPLTPETIANMPASQFEKTFMLKRSVLFLEILELLKKTSLVDAVMKRKAKIQSHWKIEDYEPVPSLISGEDVIRLGIPAGPKVRELLESIRDRQLDGIILNRESALKWIQQHI